MTDYLVQLAEWERINNKQLGNQQLPNWPKLLEIAKGLAAIVDKLPKYADTGAPITIGSTVYAKRKWSPGLIIHGWQVINVTLSGVVARRADRKNPRRAEAAHFMPSECYSSPEAVEAAQAALDEPDDDDESQPRPATDNDWGCDYFHGEPNEGRWPLKGD